MGEQIRAARRRAGLTLKELGSAAGVSASLLSQVENGRARPSVTTLYSVVAALGVSFDELLQTPLVDEPATAEPAGVDAGLAKLAASGAPETQRIRRPGERPVLEFDSGVTWEQLTNPLNPFIDHLLVTYPPQSSSSGNGQLYTHFGFEHIYLISGTLDIVVDFERGRLEAGDSIAFDCNRPHLFQNRSETVPAVGVWFILGRHSPALLQQIPGEIRAVNWPNDAKNSRSNGTGRI